jgi:DNA-binding beta-propeller fold protein YncE
MRKAGLGFWGLSMVWALQAGCSSDATPADASVTDSGAADAGAVDAGAVDVGAVDAGAVDAGAVDAGAVDAGGIDSGAADSGAADAGAADAGAGAQHEVWLVDQADTTTESGGTVYIYPGSALGGSDLSGVVPTRIDLGAATRTLCVDQTRSAPRRPHMLLFSPDERYAVLSFVATGHVVFFNAATRTPVACIDVGLQAHAAFPTPDGRHVVVANQNGKLLQRINTDWATGTFTLDESATLNLATCTTPSGAPCEGAGVRPDNAPICPVVDEASRLTFVTLRGGGMFVVDHTQSPMRIVAEYDRSAVAPNGCGGVQHARRMYINSGGGTAATPLRSALYAFDLDAFAGNGPRAVNTPAPQTVFDFGAMGDSHGAVLLPNGRYLWNADRARNHFDVVDTTTRTRVAEIPLAGTVSTDPAPDLLDVSPDGTRVYAALRGLTPLTANDPSVNNAVGATPGLAVIDVTEGGRGGTLRAIARVSNRRGEVERADPHGLRVRRIP